MMALLAGPAPAQERPRDPAPPDTLAALALPDAVAGAVVDFFNDPRRLRYVGPTRIASGEVVRQDVVVLEGPLEVVGRVEGSVVVVNGDVRLRPGAAITGDLLVVGGRIEGVDSARLGGEILAYSRRLEYRREGERIVRVRPEPAPRETPGWGRGDFLITTGKSYNRVEGLPITFGPRVATEGANPLRVHALGIYRTEAGLTLDTEEMGYYVRAEQFLGGRRTLRVGLTAHSLVDPIEEWHLTDLENGLATFLFHRDYRDHYEREGLSGFVTWEPGRGPLALTAEARWEEHRSLPVGNPWTLVDNAEPWRSQPLVAEGDLATAALQLTLDTRSSVHDPATGWYVRGRVEQAFRSELTRPAAFWEEPDRSSMLPEIAYGNFATGRLEVRRYNRVDPESRLNLRVLLGGSLDGIPLPPQWQHALGGEGSLPGYPLFSMDCGARSELVYRQPVDGTAPGYYPYYGCDAFALLQADFRGKLGFRLRLDDAPWEDEEGGGWAVGWDVSPDWTIFVDAGRAWTYGTRPDEGTRVDVGAGLLVDRFGVYLARPLSGGSGVNVFVRLGPRF